MFSYQVQIATVSKRSPNGRMVGVTDLIESLPSVMAPTAMTATAPVSFYDRAGRGRPFLITFL
jgi:hypothetical protein